MSDRPSSSPASPAKGSHQPSNYLEHLFEVAVFASRWIQAPLYGGLIVAELLYAYKFLIELWEMVTHIHKMEETVFMLGVLGLIDVTMVGESAHHGGDRRVRNICQQAGLGAPSGPPGLADPRRSRHHQDQAGGFLDRHLQHSSAKAFVDVANENPEHLKWKIFIHMTFLASAILLAWTDKIMQKDKKH